MKHYAIILSLTLGLAACGESTDSEVVATPELSPEEQTALEVETLKAEEEAESIAIYMDSAEAQTADLDAALNELDF